MLRKAVMYERAVVITSVLVYHYSVEPGVGGFVGIF